MIPWGCCPSLPEEHNSPVKKIAEEKYEPRGRKNQKIKKTLTAKSTEFLLLESDMVHIPKYMGNASQQLSLLSRTFLTN